MDHKTVSENSGAVRASRPANEKPPPHSPRLTALQRHHFFFFLKGPTPRSRQRLAPLLVSRGRSCLVTSVQSAIMAQGRGHKGLCDFHRRSAAERAFLLRVTFQLPTVEFRALPHKMCSFHTARVGRADPTFGRAWRTEESGAVCAPLGGFSGAPPAHLPGGPRSSPEAKNKGDALAGARGAGSPGAAAAPPPHLRRPRPPLPRRPAPSAARNGGHATKWQPGTVTSGRSPRQNRRHGLLPPGAATPARAAPWWWPPPALRTVPAAPPSSAFPHQPLQFAGQRALPFLFQVPPCPGGACEQDKNCKELSPEPPGQAGKACLLRIPTVAAPGHQRGQERGGHQTIYPS